MHTGCCHVKYVSGYPVAFCATPAKCKLKFEMGLPKWMADLYDVWQGADVTLIQPDRKMHNYSGKIRFCTRHAKAIMQGSEATQERNLRRAIQDVFDYLNHKAKFAARFTRTVSQELVVA